MAQYRKKPVVIEATQWNKDGDHPNVTEIPAKILDTIEARTAAIDINDCRWIAWHEWAETHRDGPRQNKGAWERNCAASGVRVAADDGDV